MSEVSDILKEKSNNSCIFQNKFVSLHTKQQRYVDAI